MILNKKLIEVALPLETINQASALEKQPFTRRHPRSIHIWWARRPLAAARAVIFAQMVDDPSSHPELFSTEEAQESERQRLFQIIQDLVEWENTANQSVLERAREEIRRSWHITCAQNSCHSQSKELFDSDNLPAFHDPFAGGGSLPLEAQRLGLEAYASDLNPIAVLINKVMIEIPHKFSGKPPLNPEVQHSACLKTWRGAQGLSEDVRYYGQLVQNEAEKRIGRFYPKIEITAKMAQQRPDLKRYIGKKLPVIAWLWARTVKSPNPAYANVSVPLVTTYLLSSKTDKEVYVEPLLERTNYSFDVKVGRPENIESVKTGTKLRGANFRCIMSGMPIEGDYIKAEGRAGRMGVRLMAIVAEGQRERVYLPPISEHEMIAGEIIPQWKPEQDLIGKSADQLPLYGMTKYWQLFTSRQLLALGTFYDLVNEVQSLAMSDFVSAGMADDHKPLRDGGTGAFAYAEAIATYISIAISRWCDLSNTLCSWNNKNQNIRALFSRQAIPMSWDYAELSPFSAIAPMYSSIESFINASTNLVPYQAGYANQVDAKNQTLSKSKIISTDPPYYDNICYADLSDFFYVWLRRSLKLIFPDLFATLAAPKVDELVASTFRYKSKAEAETFFLNGMTQALNQLANQSHPAFPITIYYAFKQTEKEGDTGNASTGWETFLAALIKAGFSITGTWPMRTEREVRSVGLGTNALASSIILVCRSRPLNASILTRRDFIATLKSELPVALAYLQRSNIAPVDLAQAAIGPGMAIFTRYSKVVDAKGNPMSVREALALINQTLDEVLAEQEGDFDSDSRWALAWFEQFGFSEGEYGVAETLSKAKNTSVAGMVEAGILISKAGKVRLLQPKELPADWDPELDSRLTAWEMVHQLIHVLEKDGERAAADLASKLGSKAEIARELCYRLYALCERKKRASLALSYNALVQSWPEIMRLAHEKGTSKGAVQEEIFV